MAYVVSFRKIEIRFKIYIASKEIHGVPFQIEIGLSLIIFKIFKIL